MQVITKMKAAGVTTIVFNGDPVAPRDFTKEATAQEYFPEWVVAAATLVDVTAFARTYDQEQWKHAFGVTQLAARTPSDQIGPFFIYKWFTGVDPPADGSIGVIAPNPALFFAVLQDVGPNLTPETFRDAAFALPGTSDGLAISQPFLSYGDKGYWPAKDYSGVDDATAIWWDPTVSGPDEIRKDGVGHVPVRRRRPALPAEPVADRRQDVRPDRRRRAVHDTAARRSPRQLPQPRRLANPQCFRRR